MKYTAFITLVTFATLAVASPELSKKAGCGPTACSCLAEPNGLFCGDGLLNCVKGNVYQCGDDGKSSCDFGKRDSCVQCNKLSCP